jgi:predicted RNase H-like HicB family nuclease
LAGEGEKASTAGRALAGNEPILLNGHEVRYFRMFVMRYAIVIEKAEDNYSAYVPDLPGCVATGATIPEVEAEIRDAIRFHVDGLKADGLAVPAPTSIAEYVEA